MKLKYVAMTFSKRTIFSGIPETAAGLSIRKLFKAAHRCRPGNSC